MGDFWQNATLPPEDTGIGFLRRTITPSTVGYPTASGTATLIPIGALPSGAIPLGIDVGVETVFNSTTTLFDVGPAGTVAGFATAAATAAQTAGFKPNLQGASAGIPVLVDTIVYVSATFTGVAPTTGKAHVICRFVPKRETVGPAWPGTP